MTTEGEPRETPHDGDSDERTDSADPGKQRTERDERWKAAKEGHWHDAGYSTETQTRSDAEDHT